MKQKGFAPILIVILVTAILVGGGYFLYQKSASSPSQIIKPPLIPPKVACTQEAKLCPNGTSVGRVGPNCEFAPCPTPSSNPTVYTEASRSANWKTYTNPELGIEFKYPDGYKVIKKDNTSVSLGFSRSGEMPFPYLQISSKNFTNDKSLILCKDYKVKGVDDFAHNCTDEVIETTLGGIKAKSFKVTYGVDSQYQIVQTLEKPKLELKMYIAGGGSSKEFDQILSTFKFTDQVDTENLKNICEEKGGKWLFAYKECESMSTDKGLDKATCTSLGGKFNECDSPCRHNPQAKACIAACIKVCKF